MRIGVVSAHFPPNFTSGGTLAPQRLARGFAAAGHDVAVYAGHLDYGRSAGASWDDVDDDGFPVRWIEIHPWIGWADDHNFDNPTVTADFVDWLVATQPDVVHVHSCQALGVGVIEATKAAGMPGRAHDARLLVELRAAVPRRPHRTRRAASSWTAACARARSTTAGSACATSVCGPRWSTSTSCCARRRRRPRSWRRTASTRRSCASTRTA